MIMGTHPQSFYWEVILIISKTLIIWGVQSMAALRANVQCLVAIFFCVANLLIFIRMKPMENDMLNNLQLISFVSQLMLLYSGLFFLSDMFEDESAVINGVFIPMALLPQVMFLVYWVHCFRIQCLIVLFVHNRPLFNSLACCTSEESFYKAHILEGIK